MGHDGFVPLLPGALDEFEAEHGIGVEEKKQENSGSGRRHNHLRDGVEWAATAIILQHATHTPWKETTRE